MSSLKRQVANQLGRWDNSVEASEAELASFLEAYARKFYPSGRAEALQRAPFRDERGRVSGCRGAAGARPEAG